MFGFRIELGGDLRERLIECAARHVRNRARVADPVNIGLLLVHLKMMYAHESAVSLGYDAVRSAKRERRRLLRVYVRVKQDLRNHAH